MGGGGRGVWNSKSHQVLWSTEFHPVFRFSLTPPLTLEPCAWNAELLSISYWDLIKFPYFADTTERGDKGVKGAQREGEDKVTLQITLLSISSSHFFVTIELGSRSCVFLPKKLKNTWKATEDQKKRKKRDKALFWLYLPIKSGDHQAVNTIKINPQFVVGEWVFVEP